MNPDIKLIKNAVMDHVSIEIDAENGTPTETWKLQYDYPSIIKCEEITGLDLKDISKWKEVYSSKYFPQVVWAGLLRNQPDITLEQVLRVLNPAVHEYLSQKVFQLLYPAAYEAWEKRLAEHDTGETESPNQQTAASTQ